MRELAKPIMSRGRIGLAVASGLLLSAAGLHYNPASAASRAQVQGTICVVTTDPPYKRHVYSGGGGVNAYTVRSSAYLSCIGNIVPTFDGQVTLQRFNGRGWKTVGSAKRRLKAGKTDKLTVSIPCKSSGRYLAVTSYFIDFGPGSAPSRFNNVGQKTGSTFIDC